MDETLLSHFPNPLLEDLIAGRWLPVIGAGMSLNANTPPKYKMPLWDQLAKDLENDLFDFEANSPIDAISAYEHEFGRPKLIEKLADILLINKSSPGDTHKAFCKIPFDIVCTTNFDFLLEKQYDRLTSCNIVIDEEQLSINNHTSQTKLLKLHGDLRHPSRLVATEEDYDSFISRYPLISTYLSNLLISRTAILIGYSLDDPDFRQIWNVVTSRLGKNTRRAYAILVDANAAEIARYNRRSVKVINLPGKKKNYGKILEKLFLEIHEYWQKNAISQESVKSEDPLIELMLPQNTATRLCYFSVPRDHLSIYRKMIFPTVEDLGFVPVVIDDVASEGDNIRSKRESLISRASIAVIDTGFGHLFTQDDLKFSINKKTEREKKGSPPLHVVHVTEKSPSNKLAKHTIHRGNLFDQDLDRYIVQLAETLSQFIPEKEKIFLNEARNLMRSGEYRSALICAIIHLESNLRYFIETKGEYNLKPDVGTITPLNTIPISVPIYNESHIPKYRSRPLPLRKIIDIALEIEFLTKEEHKDILKFIYLRNEAVHTAKNIRENNAQEAIKLVSSILERLRKTQEQ
ncbi:SIR2 family protein [Thalassospira tepidiphila]|uniref:SIR2 family protein n=1 Tax=Thalassospira tepidiphila TaxID=393657 RepID=UPI003AA950CF